MLNRLIDGQPGLIVDPRCVTIHKGFVSGYRYRRIQITGTDKYDVVPDKNRFAPARLVAIHAARRRRGPPAHSRRFAGQVDRRCPRVGRVCPPASVIAQLEQIQDLPQP